MRRICQVKTQREWVDTHPALQLTAIHCVALIVKWVCLAVWLSAFVNGTNELEVEILTVSGLAAGLFANYSLISARLEPWLNAWLESRVHPFSTDLLSDARTIIGFLPAAPANNCVDSWSRDSVILALDKDQQPITVPLNEWRESHCEIVGATGFGKSTEMAVIGGQTIYHHDGCVFVIDCKGDKNLPSVLQTFCRFAERPYVFVDLNDPRPQLNLLHGVRNAREVASLFIEGFSLNRTGSEYDYFRLFERCAARAMADAVLLQQSASIVDCNNQAADVIRNAGLPQERTFGFKVSLDELTSIGAFNTHHGIRLHETLARGGCFYIRGSLDNEMVQFAQRMLLLRIMQILRDRRECRNKRHATIFLDDARFIVGPAVARMLATIRDCNANVVLAHNSLEDLGAEQATISNNCSIRIAFRAHDEAMARHMGDISGTIPVRQRLFNVHPNSALYGLQMGSHTEREVKEPLIDMNTALHLPKQVAVFYGLGPAKLGGISRLDIAPIPQKVSMAKPQSEGTLLMAQPLPSYRQKKALPMPVPGTGTFNG
jgi:Helicase HerA, central domain